MRRITTALIAAAASVALGQIASAADLPVKAPPLVAAPVFSWTGFYIGGNAGYAWGNADVATSVALGSYITALSDQHQINTLGAGKLHPSGFVGGAQAGYNYQTGHVVFGIELDFQAFDLHSSRAISAVYPNTLPIINTWTLHQDVHTNWLFTARPRLGWAFNNWLLYATGGVAVTDLKSSFTFSDNAGFNYFGAGTASSTKTGWTVGGGVEYGLTRNWSLKAEYLYVDFGTVSIATLATANVGVCTPATCNNAFLHSADLKENIVRGGINYRF